MSIGCVVSFCQFSLVFHGYWIGFGELFVRFLAGFWQVLFLETFPESRVLQVVCSAFGFERGLLGVFYLTWDYSFLWGEQGDLHLYCIATSEGLSVKHTSKGIHSEKKSEIDCNERHIDLHCCGLYK